jgi:hypothetical protein
MGRRLIGEEFPFQTTLSLRKRASTCQTDESCEAIAPVQRRGKVCDRPSTFVQTAGVQRPIQAYGGKANRQGNRFTLQSRVEPATDAELLPSAHALPLTSHG